MVATVATMVFVMLIRDHLQGEFVERDGTSTRIRKRSRHQGAHIGISR